MAIQSLLNLYESASGQCHNRLKSYIFFSVNTKVDIRLQLTNLSDVPSCSNHDKYLVLPTYVGKAKYETFETIKYKVWARLDNWKNNHLSSAWKELILKFMVQAIPTYAMSLFQLPKKLRNNIGFAMTKF